MNLHAQNLQLIREHAEAVYYDTLSVQYQAIIEPLVREVQALYPKRDIKMYFGNGGCVVSFGGSNMFNPFIDHYGNLNSASELDTTHRVYTSLPDNHPLLTLCECIDELYDMKGYCPPLDDIK